MQIDVCTASMITRSPSVRHAAPARRNPSVSGYARRDRKQSLFFGSQSYSNAVGLASPPHPPDQLRFQNRHLRRVTLMRSNQVMRTTPESRTPPPINWICIALQACGCKPVAFFKREGTESETCRNVPPARANVGATERAYLKFPKWDVKHAADWCEVRAVVRCCD
jgi:hypothetical protein